MRASNVCYKLSEKGLSLLQSVWAGLDELKKEKKTLDTRVDEHAITPIDVWARFFCCLFVQ